jgi:hypothetical protein
MNRLCFSHDASGVAVTLTWQSLRVSTPRKDSTKIQSGCKESQTFDGTSHSRNLIFHFDS